MNLFPRPQYLFCIDADQLSLAQSLAVQLDVELQSMSSQELALHSKQADEASMVLLLDQQGLALQPLGAKAAGPIRADFTSGAVDHRRKFGGGSGQMIAKAVGVKLSRPLSLLDATAGLGRDAFVLASLGCQVQLYERHPVVAALLADGLQRAGASFDDSLRVIVERLSLLPVDSLSALAASPDQVDVVYLDPMFPERSKSASVKKEMAVFHQLVGRDEDADGLLPLAQSLARYRVVVKRPRKAPFLNNQSPSYQLSGKTSRYDIYVNRKLPD